MRHYRSFGLSLCSSTFWLEWAFKIANLMVSLPFKVKSICFNMTYKSMTYKSAYLCLTLGASSFSRYTFYLGNSCSSCRLSWTSQDKIRFLCVPIAPSIYSHYSCCYREYFWSVVPLSPHFYSNWKSYFSPLCI